MGGIKPEAFVGSTGPRPVSSAFSVQPDMQFTKSQLEKPKATGKDLIKRFSKLMRDNKGGLVDFPLHYIEDHALKEALEPLRANCHGTITDEELFKGAQLAKGSLNPLTLSSRFSVLTYHSGAFARCR